MRQRRAWLLALVILVALPVVPAYGANPRPDPSPSRPTVAPGTGPTPAPTDGPGPASTPPPSPDPSAGDPVTSVPATPAPGEPAPAAPETPETAATATPEPTAPPDADVPDPRRPRGGLDPRGRYIVVLRDGADLATGVARGKRLGATVVQTFRSSFRGYVATVGDAGRARLLADPAVAAVVPDEIVGLTAQHTPTGVRRIKTGSSELTHLDGIDQGVDADVAIVDTGIDATHPDLNVVGGYNCSTADRSLWRDRENHGTHVAGTVGARDNGIGVVGVAPGVRLWAVKILNDEGFGYLSWYVCGLDWIAAQRDPSDPGRPLFEAVNMSVAKTGTDDRACGTQNADVLHAAICRVVNAGIPVIAAAGNDRSSAAALVPASYNEVITVSALADTDGKAGGLGGNLCYSWGTYDQDDTLADFSNGGSDVDLIAPGKCIYSTLPGNRYGYSSGTSMAAPHVTAAAALYRSTRPDATPSEVRSALQYLGTMDWRWWTDRDSYHEKLLDISRLDRLGDFAISVGSPSAAVGEKGTTLTLPVTVNRSSTFFERVRLTLAVETGIGATFSGSTSLYGFTARSSTVTVTIPPSTRPGNYTLRVMGSNWGRERSDSTTITVEADLPTVRAATLLATPASRFDTTSVNVRATWPAATDPTSAIAGYEYQVRVDGGAWSAVRALSAASRSVDQWVRTGHLFETRLRARDASGNWSPWVQTPGIRPTVVQDSSGSIVYGGSTWGRLSNPYMSGGTTRYSTRAGASAKLTFTGRGIAVVMPRGPTRGAVRVYLDGTLVTTVSTWASELQGRRIVWSRAFTASGTHTITLVVVGTSGRPRVDLDAVLVS